MRRMVLLLAALAALAAVFALVACDSSGGAPEQGQREQPKEEPKEKKAPDRQVAPDRGAEKEKEIAKGPEDKTLKLTIPKMEQIEDDTVPTGKGTRMKLFKEYAAVHLAGTDFPWEEEGNVYIAGHRLGFKNTDSWLAFYDLEVLENGDEVYVTDANGKKYTYEIFEKKIVEPTDLSVLEPIEGKSVLTLQTCTLPDYSDRVVYHAELKS